MIVHECTKLRLFGVMYFNEKEQVKPEPPSPIPFSLVNSSTYLKDVYYVIF